ASMVFRYGNGSLAGFANFFRYKLLAERGGWWADADVVCLRRFAFAEPHVFASERAPWGVVPTSGVIKAPPGSPAMAWAWRKCEGKDTARLAWGETGPRLVAEAMRTFSLQRYLQPAGVFSPLGFEEWHRVLAPRPPRLPRGTRAVHLWNEMWRRAKVDKDGRFHPGCLYERLKRAYLGPA
ncbi:MAG TPA: hypothetical protein VJT67_18285, partial [Longimicrobiaceae bacterium]|nr:hypothetical protein [Longimicrobiaceae bacterium]